MQSNFLKLAALAVAGVLATTAFGQVKWVSTYDAAAKQAKSDKKLVMIEFYTAWDMKGWSGRMEEDTFQDPAVQRLVKSFVPVRLDVEKEGKTLGKKYNITNYPTILFVDARGNDMGRIDGYEPPEEFRKHAETFQKDFVREPALRSKYKSSPKNIDTVVALGVIEANRYNTSAALKKLSEAEKIDAGNRSGKITELYSAVADIYQNAASYDHAISYFKKAAGTAKKTTPKAYALLSIATCYLSKEGPLDPNAASDLDRRREHIIANCKLALPYLNETLKLPNLSAEDKEIAESNIAQIKSILSDVDGE